MKTPKYSFAKGFHDCTVDMFCIEYFAEHVRPMKELLDFRYFYTLSGKSASILTEIGNMTV